VVTYPSDQGQSAGAIPTYLANRSSTPAQPNAFPATVNGGATFDAGVIPALGSNSIAVGATLSQAGQIVVTRYLDAAGLVVLDVNQVTMLAGAPTSLVVADMAPWASFDVRIVNTSGGAANLTNAAILVG
jgi:hypothetical protein